MNKINAAYGLGGPQLMVTTVEQATGLVVNDYVEVDFLGFVKVIDALGGVNICLPFAVDDSYSGLHLSAGRHHVDGITALKFARDRHSFALSDLARIKDQQQLLSSLFAEATQRRRAGKPDPAPAVPVLGDRGGQGGQGLRPGPAGRRAARPPAVGRQFTTVPLASANYHDPDRAGRGAVGCQGRGQRRCSAG